MASRTAKPPSQVKLTNQDKLFYPGSGDTKGDVVAYYRDVAPWILPHLKNRPVTLIRFPDGVGGKSFYEKNAPKFTPDWVTTYPVPRHRSGGDINYILVNHPATLVWCANLAAIELHPFLHRVPAIDRPTALAFDLDPGEGSDLLTCIEVAFHIKEILDALGLAAFPKVTGSKGLQIYVPLNTAVTYEVTSLFAKAVATLLEQQQPDLVVSKMSKLLRRNRVMIDWSQNNPSKTTVGVYSLRAKRDEPFVSMPVEWKELTRAQRQGRIDDLYFDPAAALARLRKRGDLFAPVLTLKQRLPRQFAADAARELETDGETEARTATRPRQPARKKKAGPKPRKTKRAVAGGGKGARARLREYARKRDFSTTAEPPPKAAVKARNGRRADEPRFVIQKHAARQLHYDFRLEMDGTLKSWAVPKGLPYEPRVKRSGFETEDHPLDYLSFEGTIPQGQYGGGTVMVWDIGTYELLSGHPDKGSLRVRLHGKKLKGDWRLYRIRSENGKNVWLIEKSEESMKPLTERQDDTSALTRRSMARIGKDNDAQWESSRA